jgi:hypothetical protein
MTKLLYNLFYSLLFCLLVIIYNIVTNNFRMMSCNRVSAYRRQIMYVCIFFLSIEKGKKAIYYKIITF